MDNKNRVVVIISSLFILFLMSLAVFFVCEDFISIINMGEEIIFSWKLFLFFFSSPLIFYFCICAIYYNAISKPAKLNDFTVKILLVNFFVLLFLSFPFSWYLDSKLKVAGYVICDKTSFNSPNKYVRNPSLCH
ncbi:DUF1240 domain-containing protein [Xenorhabdus bovienii]|uniref:DUF1240 domain-containing protein n=1 Tax=Xenorhabdus bovienii TaxID=40576 RepID=UPI00237CC654|nr:DUF1240 domain-containing protein [Xenorhabdus bovienii]MDE1497075.1 DUF1240 domain-containing protein [Xenorhabdus bovienii]MDE9437879.1 DUF1240 domain-containing protein [Xenorhabdus bovienii]MDE9447474.1 DUF1240 domain-containing protein [Xenorhabdus bovienii]MDE9475018.1 DUF1240 domain-containing protein [Xenorhabdus bovienii]MDE9484270.1 DUF1240 domain-containing protein [Xenorhabdus bovienii]